MKSTEQGQNLINQVKANMQKVVRHDSFKLQIIDEAPCLVETQEVVRTFPMPLVFDGKCVGTREVEGDAGHKETVEELVFEGKLYMGDTFDIYQVVEGELVEYVVNNPFLEKAIMDYMIANYGL